MQLVVQKLLTNYKIYIEGTNAKNADLLSVYKDGQIPLVILHGWRQDISVWDLVAQKLSYKRPVILLDLPGFGSTAKPQDSYSIYDYSDFVVSFLDKLEVTKFDLLGHSFGGRLGIILASASLSNDVAQKPIKVNKLILVDSAGIEKQPPIYKLLLPTAKKLFNLLPNKFAASLRKYIGSSDYNKAGEMKEIFVRVVNEDLEYLLPNIDKETLIVWGSNDRILDIKMTKVFKEKIQDSEVRIVWGSGHSPHIDKPLELVEILGEFLDA